MVANRLIRLATAAVFFGFVGSAITLAGCSGAPAAAMPEPPPRLTRATLAGPLCQGTACRCRTSDAEAGKPANAAYKRYEFVLGPSDSELWATVNGMVLYKSVQRATECFYVDLESPGEHPVTLRAKGDAGFGARLRVRELNSASPAWYDTFEFICGAPGACRLDQLRGYRSSLERYKRRLHDPCGSTKIRGLLWDTGRVPDVGVPANLYVQLRLQVYPFVPKHPPGDKACRDRY